VCRRYGVRPSEVLKGSLADLMLDATVMQAAQKYIGLEVQRALNKCKSAEQATATLMEFEVMNG